MANKVTRPQDAPTCTREAARRPQNNPRRLQRRFRYSKQNRLTFSRFAAFVRNLIVCIHEGESVNLIAPKEIRVSSFSYAHLEKHTGNNHLQVLVVNGYALQASVALTAAFFSIFSNMLPAWLTARGAGWAILGPIRLR